LGGQTVAGHDPGRRTAMLHSGTDVDYDLFGRADGWLLV
jgi:hypothetical protein